MWRPWLFASRRVHSWKTVATRKGLWVEDKCLSAKKGVNQFTLVTRRPSQRCFAFLYLFLRIGYWSSSSLTQQALSLVSLYITFRVTEKVWTDTSVKLPGRSNQKHSSSHSSILGFFCYFVGWDADFELTCITGCCSAQTELVFQPEKGWRSARMARLYGVCLTSCFWNKPNFHPFKAKRPIPQPALFFFSIAA